MNVKTAIFLPVFITLPLLTGCNDETVPPVDDTKRVVDHVYPSPSGPYRVGTLDFDLTDYREDTLNPVSGEMRKLHIKVYYPSNTESAEYEKYFDEGGHQVEYLSSVRPPNAPIHPKQHDLNEMLSWSVNNAEVAEIDQGWPVLFYSHGSMLFEKDNVELLEELASQGFAVVAINHTFASGLAVFNNGTTVKGYIPEGANDINTDKGFAYFNGVAVPQITQDVLTTYQWLLWNQWRFQYQLDTSKVGALGYSLGGSAAMNSCKAITECVAAANMDGIILGDVAESPMNKPLMLMQAANHNLSEGYKANQSDTYLVSVADTNHNDFTDQSRWAVGFPSGIGANDIHDIVQTSMTGFFSHYLKDKELVFSEHINVSIQRKEN
ncbi:alpha/beta hydrolase family protein [Vibrio penaeicida]|uniref:alpha/beta hydrolase family protein n=1 Tax=Vibrio penaeicida TaxID=104609 RepID=UPI000CE9BC1E|nr:hypothetical protein [Vibrio penaeicida]